ncbi:putative NRPS-like protein biosynthetic cluster [Eutypa lata]|nr:putative NRPS-like protein biosynthetic cluster [Eutypa lata]
MTHQAFEQGKFDSELSFWKSELSVLPPPLPVLRVGNVVSHPPLTAYENERVDIRFQPGLKSKVQELCRSCMVTPFHFYLTVFRVLLLRYASTEDVSIGIADANRINDSTIGSIGSFVNLIPLCFHTKATASFVEVVKETRDKAYAALANSRIPFQVLLNE